MPSMQKIPVYVVSCETAMKRRALIKAHLDGLRIEYQLIDAVIGANLDPEYRERVNPTKNMTPGDLGCYLSHIHLYEHIIANQLSVALVLEDDTVLDYRVKALLDDGCGKLDFDYCFLCYEDRGDESYVFYDADSAIELGNVFKAYLLSSGPYCTNAYLITLEGAKKRMQCAFPARTPIDHYHFLPYRPCFRAVVPVVAFMNVHSAIDSLSSTTWTLNQQRLHKYWWFYPLRDLIKFKPLKKMLFYRRAKFPHAGRWYSYSSAVKVVPRNRY